jgi:prophage maintenance system killer protein
MKKAICKKCLFLPLANPFVDGNKRIAAACFLLFLHSNDLLHNNEEISFSNDALASLTLFIASSKPEEMDTVKKLVISVLNRNRDDLR